MINPSISGWVDKYFEEKVNFNLSINKSEESFYEDIQKTGFTYGYISKLNYIKTNEFSFLKSDEIAKLALLENLFITFCFLNKNTDNDQFISIVNDFYNNLNTQNFNFLKKIVNANKSSQLEKTIENRIKTNDDLVRKQFSSFVINSLLFIDILAFEHFLKTDSIKTEYYQKIEELIISIVTLSFQIKTNKSSHDDLLIKFFESSLRYTSFSKNYQTDIESLKIDFLTTNFEKFYMIDIAIMSLYSDSKLEINEIYFLQKLAEKLQLDQDYISQEILIATDYFENYKLEIPYLNTSKSIKKIYEHTNKSVVFLLKRNKKRLIKEISQSKELMILLSKSTTQELNDAEKKKIKTQLLDICKTIPSLTLFLLPGGGLLLPLLVKFIPQLLPSAFNENLEKNES